MANESIISVPPSLDDPITLRRFLAQLVEKIDIVIGTRGNDEYVKQSELTSVTTTLTASVTEEQTTLASVSDQTDTNTAAIADNAETIDDNTTAIASNVNAIVSLSTAILEHTVLNSTYYDFDNAAYADLEGRFEFSADGASITNAPYPTVGGTTYYNFLNTATTANGGVVQELKVYDDVGLIATGYYRIGDTWAEAQTVGWATT